MKILKYKKKKNGQYELQLESGEVFVLYEEVILKFELLLKKDFPFDEKESILLCNQEYDVYYVALKALKNRFRSVKDLKELLLKKEYPVEYVEKAIDKLLKQGYLNDQSFAKAYINNQMITSSKGPRKIEKELLDKELPIDLILNAHEHNDFNKLVGNTYIISLYQNFEKLENVKIKFNDFGEISSIQSRALYPQKSQKTGVMQKFYNRIFN